AAALGQELTLPGVGQTVVLTRAAARATPMPPGEELTALAATGATLVLHLAVQSIDAVAAARLPRYGAECPAALVARARPPDGEGSWGAGWARGRRGSAAGGSAGGPSAWWGGCSDRPVPTPAPCTRGAAPGAGPPPAST